MTSVRTMTMTDTNTFWNGEPCEARQVRVIVGTPLKPTWWCAHLQDKERAAVQVAQHGQVFYLDNEDGSGWRKVTEGRGMPNYPHSSLPNDSQVIAVVVPIKNNRTITWFVHSPDAGDPDCLCSYCGMVISDEDVPAIRQWNEKADLEARFHIDCWNKVDRLMKEDRNDYRR